MLGQHRTTIRSVLVALALIPAWWITSNYLNQEHVGQEWLGFAGAAAVEGVYWYALVAVLGEQRTNIWAWLMLFVFGAASYAAQVLTFEAVYEPSPGIAGAINFVATYVLPAAPTLAPLAIAFIDLPPKMALHNPFEGRFNRPEVQPDRRTAPAGLPDLPNLSNLNNRQAARAAKEHQGPPS